MKALYKFNWDCGRMGDVDGIFIAEEAELEKIIGKEIYFGEILGKHSEIFGELEKKDLTTLSKDQEVIAILEKALGNTTISGYNPLDYYEEDND